MKMILKKCICGLLLAVLFTGSISFTSFAASDYPEVFDFGSIDMKMYAGETKELWVQSKYDYVVYMTDHTSKGTYIECSCKKGSENAKIHIGADEQNKSVIFYFYIDEDPYKNGDNYAGVRVTVEGINPIPVDPNVAALKYYANNNAAFNAYYYYVNYPDLQVAFGLNGDALLNHYITYGVKEGRIANKLK